MLERQPAKSGCSKFSISRSTGRKVDGYISYIYFVYIYICLSIYAFIYVAIKDAKHVNTSRGFQLVIEVLGLQGLEAWPLGWFEKQALLSALVAGQSRHPSRTPRYQTMSAISYILLHHHIFRLFSLSSHLSLFLHAACLCL